MDDFILSLPKGSRTARKTLGRGSASGKGGTCGKGHKGQKARSGGGTRLGFEGGQMPLFRRLPRRGFSNHPFKKSFHVVNVSDLQRVCEDGETVTSGLLVERGLIRNFNRTVKVLGDGKLTKKLRVDALVSASARRKIEAVGGTVVSGDKKASRTPAKDPATTQVPKGSPAEERGPEDTAGKESDGE